MILPSLRGTLRSHLTRTFLPLRSPSLKSPTDFLAISTVVERMTLDEDIFDGMAGEYAQAPATAANWIGL